MSPNRHSSVSFKSVVLVAVQLLCVLALALPVSQFREVELLYVIMLAVGGAIAVWGIATIRLRNLRAVPDVAPDARLVTTGPYRFIRHPMYTGLLFAALGILLNHFTLFRLVVWAILLADLLIKLHYEETLLTRHFPDYAEYSRRTKRLIPYIY